MNEYLIGLDIGSSGGRCVLVHGDSGAITTTHKRWTHRSVPGLGSWAFNLDTETIWKTLGELTRAALARVGAAPDRVVGIAATSFRHGLVLLDGQGQVLFAAPNKDARAASYGINLGEERGLELHQRTGHFPSPVVMAARLLYLRHEQQELLKKGKTALNVSDWVTYQLCGAKAAEASQAAETSLLDLETCSWAVEIINSLELPLEIFPRIVSAGTKMGTLSASAALHLGLKAGIPVAAGGADTQCGLLGLGMTEPGHLGVIAGSTTPVMLTTAKPVVDKQARTWTGLHAIYGQYVIESNAGQMGAALEWVANVLYSASPSPLLAMDTEASLAPIGAHGFISTIGAQIFNAAALSLQVDNLTFTSLNSASSRASLARATYEGMAYAIRANIEQVLEVAGAVPSAIHLGGGMIRAKFWPQMIANITGDPILLSQETQVTGLGAAICAGVGAGVFSDLIQGAQALSKAQVIYPQQAASDTYQELYHDWNAIRHARASSDATAAGLLIEAIGQSSSESAPSAPINFRPRIFVSADAGEDAIQMLRSLGEVTYESYREGALLDSDDLAVKLKGFQIFITEVDIVDAAALRKLPDLRLIFVCRNNPVNIDLNACTAAGIPVLNTPGRNADAVADLTIAFMLMLSRKLLPASAFLHEPGAEAGDMGRMGAAFSQFQGNELWHKTIGLVGCGAIGRKVIQRLLPYEARLLVYDPYLSVEQIASLGAEPVSLAELCSHSDIISLHASVSEETRGLINAQAFAQMKPGVFLINTARAALIDHEALISALQSGKIGGAALDVFPVEPPGADDPLLAFPNVIATPHIGGNTCQVGIHQGQIIVDELQRLLTGEKPRFALNPSTLDTFSWFGERRFDEAKLIELSAGPAPGLRDLDLQPTKAMGAPAARPNAVSAAPPTPAALLQVGAVPSMPGPSSAPSAAQPFPSPEAKQAGGVIASLKKLLGIQTSPTSAQTTAAQVNTASPAPSSAILPPPSQPSPTSMSPTPNNLTSLDRFVKILQQFILNVAADADLAAFAQSKKVIMQFTIKDANQVFFLRFAGQVEAGMGEAADANVRLKMSAEIFDGMFTGQINASKAAMSGKISFSGDTTKAMSLQKLQPNLQKAYQAARQSVGDPGDLTQLAAAQPTAQAASPAAPSAAAIPSAPTPPPGAVYAAPLIHKTGDVRDEILTVTNELYAKGLITPTGGNVSARLENRPNEVWITPSAIFKGDLKPDMMVKVDLEGNILDDGGYGYGASSERRVHCAVYARRPEIMAVIHTHAPYATLMALTGTKFLPISTEAAFFGDAPIVPFIMPGTPALGDLVAQAMGDKGFLALMQNHGLVVAGSSLRRAADMTDVVETTAHKLITCRLLNITPPVLPDEIVAQLNEMGSMLA